MFKPLLEQCVRMLLWFADLRLSTTAPNQPDGRARNTPHPGWTRVTCLQAGVRLLLIVAPVSGSATGRRYASGCWPARPRPPEPRSARGLRPGSASSPGRETAPRCDPRCRRESVGSFERPAVLQGFPLHRLVSAALAASGTFANLSGSTPAECLRRRVK